MEARAKEALCQAPVLYSDETRPSWAHVTCTNWLTHYAIHPRRGRAATDAMGILPTYHRVNVHDGWIACLANSGCHHALCNIHYLRELAFLHEQYQ